MIGTCFESTNLTVDVREPLLSGRAGQHVGIVTPNASGWTHSSGALGGFLTAKIMLQGSIDFLDEWFDAGLGRDITLYGQGNEIVWNGFVNLITYGGSSLSAVRGPYLDIGNRAYMIFSTIDTTTSPPTLGIRLPTATYNDTMSQRAYGILQKILSAGGCQPAIAEQIVQTYLEEHAEPETSLTAADPSTQPMVTLDCVGYNAFLTTYDYNATTAGTQNLSTKLAAILAADPNGIFAAAEIAVNTLAVKAYEQDNKEAWALIKSLVAMGDANEARYLFGIYEGRTPRYHAAPTTIAYERKLTDQGQRIITAGQSIVKPWEVKASHWLFHTDFLVGRTQAIPAELRTDPRCAFLETVTYTAPWGLTWTGAKMSRLDQKLARLGLSGIGA